jgi:hypothetical protein
MFLLHKERLKWISRPTERCFFYAERSLNEPFYTCSCHGTNLLSTQGSCGCREIGLSINNSTLAQWILRPHTRKIQPPCVIESQHGLPCERNRGVLCTQPAFTLVAFKNKTCLQGRFQCAKPVFCSYRTCIPVTECGYEWGRRTRRPLHRDHILICCASSSTLFRQ